MLEYTLDTPSHLGYWCPITVAQLLANEEVNKYGYKLNNSSDVDTSEEENEIHLAVLKEQLALQKKLDGLEMEMAGSLEELGYGH